MKNLIYALVLMTMSESASAATITIGPSTNNAVFWVDRDTGNNNTGNPFQTWGLLISAPSSDAVLNSITLYAHGSGTTSASYISGSLYAWDANASTT